MNKTVEKLVGEALELLSRILRIVPAPEPVDWSQCKAALWKVDRWGGEFIAHRELDDIGLDDLFCIDDQKQQIELNTRQFLAGYPANNVLLWGARGTGKSSLVHGLLNRYSDSGLRLVEVNKSLLEALPDIVYRLQDEPFRFVLFCDDLSFEADDASYKVLKSALEGSIFKSSKNVLIYATSNRRHLLPEYMSDNEQATFVEGELHQSEAVEEKISLSDRFGLWLSFYPFNQEAYLAVVKHWLRVFGDAHGVAISWDDTVRAASLRWALARGVRSGRTAQYFARHWTGGLLIARGESENG
ncbi:MAG: ATP-binding protein [Gammaproteobacteria bacterium]|nr:MAG: ATP-binding protein [Gammaproteobacteria bacterium]TDJ36931.1 MAG: ATP-binding protein [Gammaproteobacteria bacterium]